MTDLAMTKAVVTTTSFGATSSNNNNLAGARGPTHHEKRSAGRSSSNNKNSTISFSSQEDQLTNMNAEIDAAVSFLTYLLVKAQFSRDSAELFRKALTSLLKRHYFGHWYPLEPLKGSGYRCLVSSHSVILLQKMKEN